MRLARRPVLATLALLLALPGPVTLAGCGKREKKPKVDFLAQPQKIEYDIQITPEPDPTPVAAPADTWAGKIKELVRDSHEDLQRCRNEFLIPFQFNKMRRRDVEFVSLSDLDETCMDGNRDKKKRGPKRLATVLAEEHAGKHPALDRYIVLATDQVEHAYVFSTMTKKIGAPDIDVVVETAQKARDRVLEGGAALDKAAAEIAKWPDGLVPDDDPSAVGEEVDLPTFQQQLVQSYGFFLADLTGAYDRYANKSWQGYDMPKMASLRRWVAIPSKRLQQDRARLAKVKGADEAKLAELRAFFDSVEAAVKAVQAGFDRYEKTPKDERGDKDPHRKGVEAAQKAALKHLTAWGLADTGK